MKLKNTYYHDILYINAGCKGSLRSYKRRAINGNYSTREWKEQGVYLNHGQENFPGRSDPLSDACRNFLARRYR